MVEGFVRDIIQENGKLRALQTKRDKQIRLNTFETITEREFS